jgi:hypothetical protein
MKEALVWEEVPKKKAPQVKDPSRW